MATLSKALELAQTTGNTTQEARVYAILSRGFRDQGLFLQEKMTAEKAFNLSRTIPIGETKCLAARVMGWAYEDRQQLDSALIFLNLAYEISDSVHMHSKAKDILENDINRLRQHGCRQPDSMFAARAQALQEYTKVLIDINKAETLKDNVEPQISRNRAIMFYASALPSAYSRSSASTSSGSTRKGYRPKRTLTLKASPHDSATSPRNTGAPVNDSRK